MWFIGVEVEQETSAPPPKKNPGSAPAKCEVLRILRSKTPFQHTYYLHGTPLKEFDHATYIPRYLVPKRSQVESTH